MVARNSTLSDLSFLAMAIKLRAIAPETIAVFGSTIAVSGQQSSAGRGEGTSFANRGSSRSQQPVLHRARRLTTAHSSQLPYLLLEPPPALRVVAKHVEARARRREQHDA